MIEKLGGLESESDYPYEGSDDTCHFDVNRVEVQLTGAVNISHNETDMAKWLVANGPISIAINANAMQFYMGGVSHPFKVLCNPNNLDHGVVIVGYGVHSKKVVKKCNTLILISLQPTHCLKKQCHTGLLRTHGANRGENKDTIECIVGMVLAV